MSDNRQILFTIGFPASGKSTWAKKFSTSNQDWVRISRDDYRLMLQQSQFMGSKGERLVTKLVEQAIAEATASKYNVIVDQTNTNLKYLRPFVNYCRQFGDVKFKIFEVSLDEAIRRDKLREQSVGEDIINRMYGQFQSLIHSDYTEIYQTLPKLADIYTPPEFQDPLPDAFIFDLDGTLFHTNGKRHHYDWKKVAQDSLDVCVENVLQALRYADYRIILVTGRSDLSKLATISALGENHVGYDELYFRKEGDFRKDTAVKREIYESRIKGRYNIIGVFDDRDSVVDMWRKLGLKCFQVQRGTF